MNADEFAAAFGRLRAFANSRQYAINVLFHEVRALEWHAERLAKGATSCTHGEPLNQIEAASLTKVATQLHRIRARLDAELANLALAGVVPDLSLSSNPACGDRPNTGLPSAGGEPVSGAHP